MRTIQMSNYTVGEDCFEAIPAVLAGYRATRIVLAGGARALAAAAPGIRAALEDTGISIEAEVVYGTDSTQRNVDAIADVLAQTAADAVFAIGGGKAIDTVKTAAKQHDLPVFSVPTICSNCSSATAIAVIYHDDGSFKEYAYPDAPVHIFINPAIIAEAPAEYFWAGIGDALSKQPEVEYATSGKDLSHTAALGLTLAHTCTEPLMEWGAEGLADVRAGHASEAVKQIALDIVVNTGYVSNLTNQPDFYYNSSLAHAFYNASCGVTRSGAHHLHGEVVSFGVLVLHAYRGDDAELERYARFNKQLGLPVTLAELDLDRSHLPQLVELAQQTNEWKLGNPQAFSPEAFTAAIIAADAFGQTLLEER